MTLPFGARSLGPAMVLENRIKVLIFQTIGSMTDGNQARIELRRMSKALLGGKYQAEVGAAIADMVTGVWGEALVETLGEGGPAKGQISIELDRLREARLLIVEEGQRFDRRKLFKPADRDSAYWALCRELRDVETG